MHPRYSSNEHQSHGHERSAGGGATAAIATCEPSDQSVHAVAAPATATKSSTNRSDNDFANEAETFSVENSALGKETKMRSTVSKAPR